MSQGPLFYICHGARFAQCSEDYLRVCLWLGDFGSPGAGVTSGCDGGAGNQIRARALNDCVITPALLLGT